MTALGEFFFEFLFEPAVVIRRVRQSIAWSRLALALALGLQLALVPAVRAGDESDESITTAVEFEQGAPGLASSSDSHSEADERERRVQQAYIQTLEASTPAGAIRKVRGLFSAQASLSAGAGIPTVSVVSFDDGSPEMDGVKQGFDQLEREGKIKVRWIRIRVYRERVRASLTRGVLIALASGLSSAYDDIPPQDATVIAVPNALFSMSLNQWNEEYVGWLNKTVWQGSRAARALVPMARAYERTTRKFKLGAANLFDSILGRFAFSRARETLPQRLRDADPEVVARYESLVHSRMANRGTYFLKWFSTEAAFLVILLTVKHMRGFGPETNVTEFRSWRHYALTTFLIGCLLATATQGAADEFIAKTTEMVKSFAPARRQEFDDRAVLAYTGVSFVSTAITMFSLILEPFARVNNVDINAAQIALFGLTGAAIAGNRLAARAHPQELINFVERPFSVVGGWFAGKFSPKKPAACRNAIAGEPDLSSAAPENGSPVQ